VVLHPSFKLDYFRKAGWTDSWIDEAVSVTREHWGRYKPAQTSTTSTMVCLFAHCSPALLMIVIIGINVQIRSSFFIELLCIISGQTYAGDWQLRGWSEQ
ncbi:hypothetical protein BT96DRAFT_816431, partial [Gymnopus androsaceus JB14]